MCDGVIIQLMLAPWPFFWAAFQPYWDAFTFYSWCIR